MSVQVAPNATLEILAPAGNANCAMTAINNGADAIYLGYSAFSARQSAENFDEEALSAVLTHAHLCDVKVYLAMNTLVKEREKESFLKILLSVWNLGVDAIILQDVLLGKEIKKRYPSIVLHLSTQAGVCNENGALFAKECGFSRVILARETPFEEIEKITKIIETEAFVQGALCTAFSGQCYFSSFVGGNSGNRGRCKQPCRKLYAYDRNENTEKNYALSLSDLCVGENIEKYIKAGVTSFKIEGRLRREEYVASAVRYYRALLDNKGDVNLALSDLKRTYNRGNYTQGLAFGQDKRFLSTAVQGHIGEKVGVVKVVKGNYFVESIFRPKSGDAFKILREGKEVSGAIFTKTESRGFVISSRERLKNGDSVFITTDTSVNERVMSATRKKNVALCLRFHAGETPFAQVGALSVAGDDVLQSAQNRPLQIEEIKNCFAKTDGLPFDVQFNEIDVKGDIFIPKSSLNAFRRKVYDAIVNEAKFSNQRAIEYAPWETVSFAGKNEKTAVIADDFNGVIADVAIYKPRDFCAPLHSSFAQGNFEKYVYYPAFTTSSDETALLAYLSQTKIDGVYVENYAGIAFAKKHGLKIFAGTGLNVSNSTAVKELLALDNVVYYALSKELNEQEIKTLVGEKAFVLSSGNIKLMDLCYCPFGRTCKECDKKDVYTLTDENNRAFPVRRYQDGKGNCRFEVYNCADLIGKGVSSAGRLMDLTLVKEKTLASKAQADENMQKEIYKNYTSGHAKRGIL